MDNVSDSNRHLAPFSVNYHYSNTVLLNYICLIKSLWLNYQSPRPRLERAIQRLELYVFPLYYRGVLVPFLREPIDFTLLLQVVPIVSERFTFNCFIITSTIIKTSYAVSKQLKLIVISQYCYCIHCFYTVGLEYTSHLFLRAAYHGCITSNSNGPRVGIEPTYQLYIA